MLLSAAFGDLALAFFGFVSFPVLFLTVGAFADPSLVVARLSFAPDSASSSPLFHRPAAEAKPVAAPCGISCARDPDLIPAPVGLKSACSEGRPGEDDSGALLDVLRRVCGVMEGARKCGEDSRTMGLRPVMMPRENREHFGKIAANRFRLGVIGVYSGSRGSEMVRTIREDVKREAGQSRGSRNHVTHFAALGLARGCSRLHFDPAITCKCQVRSAHNENFVMVILRQQLR